MFWESSPSSANPASDWLRAKRVSKLVFYAQSTGAVISEQESKESSPVDEEERKMKIDDGVDISIASEGIDLFVDLWEAQPCLWDPERYSS